MNYYCDITLLPDAEATLGFLWHRIYTQIHLALVEHKNPEGNSLVAISFPEYGVNGFPLGTKLRLFASTEETLNNMRLDKWLARFNDYCHFTSVRACKPAVRYVRFSRKQFKSNLDKVALRRANHMNISIEESREYVNQHYEEKSKLPFLNLTSISSNTEAGFGEKDRFKLFIDRTFLEKPTDGVFNCYGLSKEASVPWF